MVEATKIIKERFQGKVIGIENRAFVKRFRGWFEKGYVTTQEISGGYTSALFTKNPAEEGNCYMCIGSSAGANHQIPKNEGENNLHSGNPGYQNVFWDGKILSEEEADAIISYAQSLYSRCGNPTPVDKEDYKRLIELAKNK